MATGNKILQPLEDPKLEQYLAYASSGALDKARILKALSQPSGQLHVLTALIRYQTSKFPWSSAAFHYLPAKGNSLDPDEIFDQLVNRRLGGHCLQFAILFASVLRAFDFKLYFIGARIGESLTNVKGFHGWSHAVLVVMIEGKKYLVDPQYQYITEPVLLDPEQGPVQFHSIPTAVVRLRYIPLQELVGGSVSTSDLKTWVFDYKYKPDDVDWLPPQYIFSTDTEWLLEDLEIMNVYLNKASDSYLRQNVFVRRAILASETGEESRSPIKSPQDLAKELIPALAGLVQIVNDNFQVWEYGKKIQEQNFKLEEERVDCMEKWFGVHLTTEETLSIQGGACALPSFKVRDLNPAEKNSS